ncbi:MAG: arylesterase [Salinibacter sp.]
MPTARLYLFLLCGVLFLSGCETDRSNSGTASPDTAETAAPDTTQSDARSSPDTTASEGVRVLVLGNSIAAGSGVSSQEAFPAQLQRKIDSLDWNVTVQNAGVSGATTAGGLRRINWLLERPVDVLVLELGGNDGLRGVDLTETRDNLTAIIDTTLSRYPDARVLLAGMRIPPNMGSDYTERFRDLYPSIAEQYERVTLSPFILRNVATVDSLMQDDGIHPTAAGQRRVAENVWETLQPILETMRTRS